MMKMGINGIARELILLRLMIKENNMKKYLLPLILIFCLILASVGDCITIKFNPTGTNIKNGVLKIRLDFYPDVDSKTYKEQYIDVFARALTEAEEERNEQGALTEKAKELQKLVPTKKQLNPFLCIFIMVNPDTTKKELKDYIKNNYDIFTLTELDSAISENRALDLRNILKGKMKINNYTNTSTTELLESDITKINNEMLGFFITIDKDDI
jgi:hypothetical protein